MAYQVFARKYRPQSFLEVIGQGPVIQTLKNAISNERIHQAYLFTGARGVGKTSMARIFAKSINCEKGPTLSPCQECAACRGITLSNSMDVLEIDGASNTGVDDIRELREQAKYLPSAGRYKIYIIDEVHMLSTSAFNALLKILEEPPNHVIFIFATTEPHKIPVTILSRCQRYDFKRMPTPILIDHLKNILSQEKVALDDESLHLIAHSAEGSVRDSLSLLDQVVSFCGSDASAEKVREILGLTDRVLLFDMLEALLTTQVQTVLEKAKQLYDKGYDLKIFSEELLQLLRDLLVLKEGGVDFIDLPPGEIERLKPLLVTTEATTLLSLFQILARGAEDLARSSFPRLVFETTLLKMIRAREILPLSAVLDQLAGKPGLPTNAPAVSRPAMPTAAPAPRPVSRTTLPPPAAPASKPVQAAAPAPVAGPAPSGSPQDLWRGFVQKLLMSKPQLGSMLEHARLLKFEGDHITLGFETGSVYGDMIKDRLAAVEDIAAQYFQRKIKLHVEALSDKNAAPPSALELRESEEKQRSEHLKAKALADPVVKKAQELLGAKVKEVKEIK